ncbi:fatty acid desaturase family protein [Tamaricihabitans halophyticus]|nr:acyl-CoA desaturase [Tamaricihabitans halophyticus]
MDTVKRSPIGLEYLSYEQLDAFGAELDALRQRVLDDLGQEDADYIRRVVRVQRVSEVLGRLGIFCPFAWPVFAGGIGALALAKILENMEIGHNVMHGQYDWMNDPALDGQRYEWDFVAPSEDWRHGHNFLHHTYTNIHGLDRDIGYSTFRVDAAQPWQPRHRFNVPLALGLMLIFEFGVLLHGLERQEYRRGKISAEVFQVRRNRALKKIGRQVLKDYVAYPALALPLVPFVGWWAPLAVLSGTAVANVIRNAWAFTVIFCGHFPAEVQTYTRSDAENETRGQWYLRQLLGSANITGSRLFHVLTGNLSYQIEHHLFPDIPARRYPQIAAEVRKLIEKYQLRYNTGRLSRQVRSVLHQLATYSRRPASDAH